MTVHLTYFAVLRDQRGLSKETRTTEAATLRELYEEIGLELPPHLVTVAVNGAFSFMEAAPQEGDEIVFIPPVAGG